MFLIILNTFVFMFTLQVIFVGLPVPKLLNPETVTDGYPSKETFLLLFVR